MHEPATIPDSNPLNSESFAQPIERVTAIWALSEAALGGLLHALHIPLTGLFIGGSAVLFITLIAFFSNKSGAILKATLIVMIVKLLASPHSPINAYLAVAFQGIAGELIFRLIKNKRFAALSLGVISLLQSAFQKLLVVTLVFGQSIWEAIDLFSDFVLKQFMVSPEIIHEFSLSAFLIILYVSIHTLGGILFGLWAPILAKNVKDGVMKSDIQLKLKLNDMSLQQEKPKSRRRKIWKKFSYVMILVVASSIVILSYLFPVFEESKGMAAIIMIIRSIIIMTIWFYVLGPFLMTKLRRFLVKKESKHQREVNDILNLLPNLKRIILESWKTLPKKRSIRSIGQFVENLLIYILSANFDADQ